MTNQHSSPDQPIRSRRAARAAPPLRLRRELRTVNRMLARRRQLRLLARGCWIALLVVVAGLVLRRAGYNLGWPMLILPAGFVVTATLIQALLSRPSLARLAQAYDRHFRLHELLATSLEVSRSGEQTGRKPSALDDQLLTKALGAAIGLRRRVAKAPLLPWAELQMLLAVALLAIGLLLPGRWSDLPQVTPQALRSLPTPETEDPSRPPVPTEAPVADQQEPEPEQLSPQDEAAADAIADALRDNGATRPAADALDQGNPGEAADELRDLAEQSDQLSDEARSEIAQGLREAADELRESQPERAERLEQQAEQIESGAQEGEEGLEDLAEMLDELGEQGDAVAGSQQTDEGGAEQPQSGGSPSDEGTGEQGPAGSAGGGAGQGLGGEQRGNATDPPAPGGEAVPLPAAPQTDGSTTPATGPRGPAVQLEAEGSGRSTGGALGGGGADTPVESEPDPLRIPPEYRDVVENYFSPAQ